MKYLWIDSRTYQKYIVLMSARQRSNNYLELSKENVFWNMTHINHALLDSSS